MIFQSIRCSCILENAPCVSHDSGSVAKPCRPRLPAVPAVSLASGGDGDRGGRLRKVHGLGDGRCQVAEVNSLLPWTRCTGGRRSDIWCEPGARGRDIGGANRGVGHGCTSIVNNCWVYDVGRSGPSDVEIKPLGTSGGILGAATCRSGVNCGWRIWEARRGLRDVEIKPLGACRRTLLSTGACRSSVNYSWGVWQARRGFRNVVVYPSRGGGVEDCSGFAWRCGARILCHTIHKDAGAAVVVPVTPVLPGESNVLSRRGLDCCRLDYDLWASRRRRRERVCYNLRASRSFRRGGSWDSRIGRHVIHQDASAAVAMPVGPILPDVPSHRGCGCARLGYDLRGRR